MADIIVGDEQPRRVYQVGGDAQSEFTVPFPFLADTDVKVAVNAGTADHVLNLGADYTVSGAGSQTGTVTLTTPVSDCTVTVYRELVIERSTRFPAAGTLKMPALNREFDRATMIAQQLADRAKRSLSLAASDDLDTNATLPVAQQRSNRLFVFDAEGRPVMSDATRQQVEGTAIASWAQGNSIGDVPVYTGDGVTTRFPTGYKLLSKAGVHVEVGGVRQAPAAYALDDEDVVLVAPPPVGVPVHIRVLGVPVPVSDASESRVLATGGLYARPVAEAAADRINVLSYIPPGYHAAIRAGTYTGDCYPAFVAAVAALPPGGGDVVMPPGDYWSSQELVIGDGSAASRSTRNGVRLIGLGGGGVTEGEFGTPRQSARILFTGAIGTNSVVRLAGPVHSCAIEGLVLDANGKANKSLDLCHSYGGSFRRLTLTKYRTIGLHLRTVAALPAGVTQGAMENRFEQLYANVPALNTADGLVLEGDQGGNVGCSRNKFELCRFAIGAASGASPRPAGIRVRFADNNVFVLCFTFYSDGSISHQGNPSYGVGVYFEPATGEWAGWMPAENTFIHCPLIGGIGGTPGANNSFPHYPTGDGEPLPLLPGVYFSSTDGLVSLRALYVGDGTAVAPSITFAGATTTGLYREAGAVGVSVAGIRRARFSASSLSLDVNLDMAGQTIVNGARSIPPSGVLAGGWAGTVSYWTGWANDGVGLTQVQRYFGLVGMTTGETTTYANRTVAPAGMWIKRLTVNLGGAPGTGNGRALTLMVDGLPTGLSLNFGPAESGAKTITLSGSGVSVPPGSTLNIRSDVTGTPTNTGAQFSVAYIPSEVL